MRIPSASLNPIRICFTCRHYPILNLDGAFQIRTEEENEEDISTYVQARFSGYEMLSASAIPALIIDRASGVFIWTRLVIEQVLELEHDAEDLEKMKAKILSVPQEIDDLYHELIRNMGLDSSSLKLIQWICFATRPLSVDELRWAMSIDTDRRYKSLQAYKSSENYISDDGWMERRVQTLSCGLAELASDTKSIQFIHQSVKDFFVEKGLKALDSSSTSTDSAIGAAQYRLSRTYLQYLAIEEIGQSRSYLHALAMEEPTTAARDDIMSEFPFLRYATTSWATITKEGNGRGVSQEDILEYFAWRSNIFVE